MHRKKDTLRNKGLYSKARVECYIKLIDWPPSSPNLNLIENVWRILKQLLRNRQPHGGWTIQQLKDAVVDIWKTEISAEKYFNKYIDSMPERLEKVRVQKGAQTKW